MRHSLQRSISIWIIIPALVQIAVFYMFFNLYVFPHLQAIEEQSIADSSSRAKAVVDNNLKELSKMIAFLASDATGRSVEDWIALTESSILVDALHIVATDYQGNLRYAQAGSDIPSLIRAEFSDSDVVCGLVNSLNGHLIACVAKTYDNDHKWAGNLFIGKPLAKSLVGSVSFSVYPEHSQQGQYIRKVLGAARSWFGSIDESSIIESFQIDKLGSESREIVEVRYARSIGVEIHRQFTAISIFLVVTLIATTILIHRLIRKAVVLPLEGLSDDIEGMMFARIASIPVEEYPDELQPMIVELNRAIETNRQNIQRREMSAEFIRESVKQTMFAALIWVEGSIVDAEGERAQLSKLAYAIREAMNGLDKLMKEEEKLN